MNIHEIRIGNARDVISQHGLATVASKMGYANSSFLVQMFGPNPVRNPTEKTMRKMEKAMGLREGVLDLEPGAASGVQASAINTEQLKHVLVSVTKMAQEENVSLNPERLANLTAMVYEDANENNGVVREGKIRQVIQLLR